MRKVIYQIVSLETGEIVPVYEGQRVSVKERRACHTSRKKKLKLPFAKVTVQGKASLLDKFFETDPKCIAVALKLSDYLHTGNNFLIDRNENRVTARMLAEELHCSVKMAYIYFHKLEEKNIVKQIVTDRGKFYVMNPFVFCVSEFIYEEIAKMFEEK